MRWYWGNCGISDDNYLRALTADGNILKRRLYCNYASLSAVVATNEGSVIEVENKGLKI